LFARISGQFALASSKDLAVSPPRFSLKADPIGSP